MMKTGHTSRKRTPSLSESGGDNTRRRHSGPPEGRSDWRLPSGAGLAEFALGAGVVAPFLLPAGFRDVAAGSADEPQDQGRGASKGASR